MKKFISHILMVILALGIFSSCNQELIQRNDSGYLSVGLDRDLTEDMVTRAGGEDELVFAIDVLNLSGEKVAGCDDHRTTVDTPIELKVGKYNVVARSGERLNAAFDAPYYEGRTATPVSIRPETTAKAEFTCSIANTAFSVELSDDLKNFSECRVSVTNGVGEPLVLSGSPDSANSLEAGFDSKAYFDVTGTLAWKLYLKNSDGGEYVKEGTIPDVKGKQHYHLTFYMGADESNDGALVLKVILQNIWDQKDHDMDLEFNKADLPQVTTSPDFPVSSATPFDMQVGDAKPKALYFSAKEGIKNIGVSHNSTALETAGIPKSSVLDNAATKASGAQISDLAAAGMVFEENLSSVTMTELFKKLPAGTYTIEFAITDNKDKTEYFILIVNVVTDEIIIEAEAVEAKAGWAAFAQLEGKFFDEAKATSVGFQYRKKSDSAWKDVEASKIDVDAASKTFKAVVYGLAPSTDYVFRAVTDTQKDTKTVTFRTSASATLHNMSFDDWTNSNKFPNASGYKIWDSANSSGAATTTKPTEDAVGGKAAVLESVSALGMMAAGNIFTGEFLGLAGLGAKLSWGTPFDARPLALRGYYKYSPVPIDKVKDPYKDLKGQMDQCQILVCLTDWDTPFEVNTKTGTFVDFDNDSAIIAFAQFNTSDSSSEYIEFTLPLVYRNDRIPKYIVIAGASSRYGDYFTGGIGSKLYIDEFELIYDPAELTEAEYNTVFGQVNPF